MSRGRFPIQEPSQKPYHISDENSQLNKNKNILSGGSMILRGKLPKINPYLETRHETIEK